MAETAIAEGQAAEDRIAVRVRQQVVEPAAPVRNPELLGRALRLLGVAVAQPHQLDVLGLLERGNVIHLGGRADPHD